MTKLCVYLQCKNGVGVEKNGRQIESKHFVQSSQKDLLMNVEPKQKI